MGQRVLGIDLGAHSVKIAEVDVGFRAARLVSLRTLAVPFGPGSSLERSLEALREMSRPPQIDAVVVGVPGDKVLLRLLEVPAVEAKRMAAVVGNELADDLPWEMEDVVYDHGGQGPRAGSLLTAAARSADVRSLLEQLGGLGLEPRALPVASLGYAGLIRRVEPSGCFVLIDLGHQRTNLCLLEDGRPLAARTISRGGQQLTEAIRAAYQLSFEEAQALKEQQARLAPDSAAGATGGSSLADITALGLAPLVRELQLSLGIFTTKLGVSPEGVLLCGGTSLLPGIEEHLAGTLALPVRRLQVEPQSELPMADLSAQGQALGALALGLALDGASRQPLDLRQGEFSYRSDGSLFKDKLVTIAISVVVVLLFAALNAFMSLRSLRQEEESLKAQLKRATQNVLGEAVLNPSKVSRLVKAGAKASGAAIPQRTAFDILHDLSSEVPGGDKVKLDITRLEIKPGKTYLTGTADTRSAIGDVVRELQKNKCFSKVATGTISDVADGKKQFSLTINTECF